MQETRNTPQRTEILNHLMSVKTHPTAEQVYNQVKKSMPKITLATVYRNLNLLAEKGEILRLEINKEYHYDADMTTHQHCVCKNCWKVIDIHQEELSTKTMKKVDVKGFTPSGVAITFYGTCDGCQNN